MFLNYFSAIERVLSLYHHFTIELYDSTLHESTNDIKWDSEIVIINSDRFKEKEVYHDRLLYKHESYNISELFEKKSDLNSLLYCKSLNSTNHIHVIITVYDKDNEIIFTDNKLLNSCNWLDFKNLIEYLFIVRIVTPDYYKKLFSSEIKGSDYYDDSWFFYLDEDYGTGIFFDLPYKHIINKNYSKVLELFRTKYTYFDYRHKLTDSQKEKLTTSSIDISRIDIEYENRRFYFSQIPYFKPTLKNLLYIFLFSEVFLNWETERFIEIYNKVSTLDLSSVLEDRFSEKSNFLYLYNDLSLHSTTLDLLLTLIRKRKVNEYDLKEFFISLIKLTDLNKLKDELNKSWIEVKANVDFDYRECYKNFSKDILTSLNLDKKYSQSTIKLIQELLEVHSVRVERNRNERDEILKTFQKNGYINKLKKYGDYFTLDLLSKLLDSLVPSLYTRDSLAYLIQNNLARVSSLYYNNQSKFSNLLKKDNFSLKEQTSLLSYCNSQAETLHDLSLFIDDVITFITRSEKYSFTDLLKKSKEYKLDFVDFSIAVKSITSNELEHSFFSSKSYNDYATSLLTTWQYYNELPKSVKEYLKEYSIMFNKYKINYDSLINSLVNWNIQKFKSLCFIPYYKDLQSKIVYTSDYYVKVNADVMKLSDYYKLLLGTKENFWIGYRPGKLYSELRENNELNYLESTLNTNLERHKELLNKYSQDWTEVWTLTFKFEKTTSPNYWCSWNCSNCCMWFSDSKLKDYLEESGFSLINIYLNNDVIGNSVVFQISDKENTYSVLDNIELNTQRKRYESVIIDEYMTYLKLLSKEVFRDTVITQWVLYNDIVLPYNDIIQFTDDYTLDHFKNKETNMKMTYSQFRDEYYSDSPRVWIIDFK